MRRMPAMYLPFFLLKIHFRYSLAIHMPFNFFFRYRFSLACLPPTCLLLASLPAFGFHLFALWHFSFLFLGNCTKRDMYEDINYFLTIHDCGKLKGIMPTDLLFFLQSLAGCCAESMVDWWQSSVEALKHCSRMIVSAIRRLKIKI